MDSLKFGLNHPLHVRPYCVCVRETKTITRLRVCPSSSRHSMLINAIITIYQNTLHCQPRVTVTSCFVYKVISNLESIDHWCINPIRRIGLIHERSTDSCCPKWSVQVNISLNNCKENMTSLSLLADRTIAHLSFLLRNCFYTKYN